VAAYSPKIVGVMGARRWRLRRLSLSAAAARMRSRARVADSVKIKFILEHLKIYRLYFISTVLIIFLKKKLHLNGQLFLLKMIILLPFVRKL